jgi:hypothetical protein
VRPEGRPRRSVSRGLLRSAGSAVRRGGPTSTSFLANQERDACSSVGSLLPGGPALCQALSRLTRSVAPAPDETGVPSRGRDEARDAGPKPCSVRSIPSGQQAMPTSTAPRRGLLRGWSGITPFGTEASPRDNPSGLGGTFDPTGPSGCRWWTSGVGRLLAPRSAQPTRTVGPVRRRPVVDGGGPTSVQDPKIPSIRRPVATDDEDSLFRYQRAPE